MPRPATSPLLEGPGLPGLATACARRVTDEAYFLAVCVRRGLIRPQPPVRAARMGLGVLTHGGIAGLVHATALRHGSATAIVDERGQVSYAELDTHANAIANGWVEHGLRPGDGVAILCRNHRWFVEALFAAAKCGARVILLNTDFAGPQLREVAGREGTDLLVHDEEYADMLEGLETRLGHWLAWSDEDHPGEGSLDRLTLRSSHRMPPRPGREATLTLLTSGTTGTPKGAARSVPRSLGAVGAVLDRVPFRTGQTMELSAPLFHSLGLASMMFAIGMGDTVVLRRRFSPEVVLRSIEEHRADNLVVVPVMLQRMLDSTTCEDADLSSLSVVFVGGSQLGSSLCTRALHRLGPVLYNLYGSTEVAYASIATPQDLAVEPATVGRVLRGSVVRVVDADGRELPTGETGRIVVGNRIQFDGYTGGGSKEVVGGLMASGDVGHFDEGGLLFIDGRDDEMIVSGGENVFPRELEELLGRHPAVVECAVVGIDDEGFGQRLKAFVVLRDDATWDEEGVKQHVRDNLARYKTPREVVFLDELPRNPTGKVLKRELRRA
jgi:fatty-acyl-CoA synthase